MRHKKRVHGETVQVVEGLAANVQSEIAYVTSGAAVRFRFLSGYKGRPKVQIQNGEKEVSLTVCDTEHGKSRITVAWQNPPVLAEAIRARLVHQGYNVA